MTVDVTETMEVTAIHATILGVPVEIVRVHDDPRPGHDEVTWRAKVFPGEGRQITTVVNSRADAEIAAARLADHATKLQAARQRVDELDHELVRMAGEMTREATDVRKGAIDDEPPF